MYVDLFLTSLSAIAKLLLISAAGIYLYKRGVLVPPKNKIINYYYVHHLGLPIFLFLTSAQTINRDTILSLWIIPFFCLLLFTVKSITAFILLFTIKKVFIKFFPHKLVQPSSETSSHPDFPPFFSLLTILAATFTNAQALPISLVESVIRSSPWMVGKNQTVEDCVEESFGFLAVYTSCVSVMMWGLSSYLIQKATRPRPEEIQLQSLNSENRFSEEEEESSILKRLLSFIPERVRKLCSSFLKNVSMFLSLPVVANVLGIIVGISFLHSFFVTRGTFFYDIFIVPLRAVGSLAIYFIQIGLGVSIYPNVIELIKRVKNHKPGTDSSFLRFMLISNSVALSVTLIICPMIQVLLLFIAFKSNMIPHGSNTTTLLFVLMIEAAQPTALNMSTICQSETHPELEKQMVNLTLFQYLFASFTLTTWISVFLFLLQEVFLQ